jgi:serine/threonine protein kinase
MAPQSLIGTTIGGRYQIEALLGQGGMSAVYRALDPNLRRSVAIKLIHPHLSADPNFIGRFKEEAAAVAGLRHPNIVQVFDFAADGDTYYMVMEYLIGKTLQARLKRLNETGRKMSFADAVTICAQICDAAGYAHGHELVHRDIKPANIMLDLHGQAILMDFGIVKIIGGEYHTSTGATIGTAMYMSPEQIRSERIDDRADIYSLGVTLYEMISGHPPYQADSAISLMMMVLNDPLPDVREIRPDVPEGLVAVVAKALRKEQADRFQSMAEMAAALRQLNPAALQQIDPGALSASPATATEVDQPAEAEKPAEAPSPAAPVLKEHMPEPQKAAASSIPRPQMIPAEPERQKSTRTEKQAQPIEHASTPRKIAGRRAKPAVRVSPWRYILIAAGALVLLAALAGGIILISTQRTPELSLTSISYLPVPINAQTAQNVVSLGSWNIDSYVTDLEFAPDGRVLGTANNRDWLRFTNYRYYAAWWETSPPRLERYFLDQKQWVTNVAFSPDGSLFASASDDSSIILWQLPGGSLARRIEASIGGITGVDFSPNNLLLAAGSWDGVVGLWQVDNGNLLRTLQAEETSIKDVGFSPDGGLLAAACENGSILIWKVSDGSLAQTLMGHTAAVERLRFSPDGSMLATASEDHSIRTWRVSDGAEVSTLMGHTETVKDVEFSLDGSLLASGSEDGTIVFWQTPDGQQLLSLRGEDAILSLAFSPDGTLLVSGAANGALQFWGISEAIPLETLTPTELP